MSTIHPIYRNGDVNVLKLVHIHYDRMQCSGSRGKEHDPMHECASLVHPCMTSRNIRSKGFAKTRVKDFV
eukprot:1356157-Amphidinium_carterae.1